MQSNNTDNTMSPYFDIINTFHYLLIYKLIFTKLLVTSDSLLAGPQGTYLRLLTSDSPVVKHGWQTSKNTWTINDNVAAKIKGLSTDLLPSNKQSSWNWLNRNLILSYKNDPNFA